MLFEPSGGACRESSLSSDDSTSFVVSLSESHALSLMSDSSSICVELDWSSSPATSALGYMANDDALFACTVLLEAFLATEVTECLLPSLSAFVIECFLFKVGLLL